MLFNTFLASTNNQNTTEILACLVKKVLASCLSPTTCVAIFETLLDLPILSAVLEGQLRDTNVGPTTDPTERAVRGVCV